MWVAEWHSLSSASQSLQRFVASLLTDRVTAFLPDEWRGTFDEGRASSWIAERDLEGTTLIAMEKEASGPVGLLILSEPPTQGADATREVHVGYVLAEASWGKGMATELLAGFVAWCRREAQVLIYAGVSTDNAPSAAVLEKNGFDRVERADDDGESLYQLNVG